MSKIGGKDRNGRLKRIEYRGRHLRVSRTGGVAVRDQLRAAGLNLTVNSKRGMRVSTRIAKGTNLGFQNGRLRLRGQYGKGPVKLNLSKSGLSVSARNALGTFNWLKPNRSSAKIMGVQVRGKNAAAIQAAYMVFALALYAVQAAAVLVLFAVRMLLAAAQVLLIFLGWLLPVLRGGAVRAAQWLAGMVRSRKRAALLPQADSLMRDPESGLDRLPSAALEELLSSIILSGGRGRPVGMPFDGLLESIDAADASDRLRILLLAAARLYRGKGGTWSAAPFLLRTDGQCVEAGGRTRLQDLLLEDFAAVCRLRAAGR